MYTLDLSILCFVIKLNNSRDELRHKSARIKSPGVSPYKYPLVAGDGVHPDMPARVYSRTSAAVSKRDAASNVGRGIDISTL